MAVAAAAADLSGRPAAELLLSFLGFAGLVILGVLMICVGLSGGLDANHDFNEQIIVHGYARRSERAIQT